MLLLTDMLPQDVRAEAQVVCVGQPLLIAGDLNADPGVIPSLAKGISSGKFVDECAGSRRDFMVGCPNALTASAACGVTDRLFTPHFSIVADFCIGRWTAEVATPPVLARLLD